MDEKIQFINEWRSGAWTVRALCAAFGVSHTLGYKYIRRWESEGVAGLRELSRVPRSHPNKTPPHLEEAIVALRKQHPRWGAEKLLLILCEQFPDEHWPAISTGNLILKRNGLVKPKRRNCRIRPVHPIFDPEAPTVGGPSPVLRALLV